MLQQKSEEGQKASTDLPLPKLEGPKSTDPVVEVEHWRQLALREQHERDKMRKLKNELEATLEAERDERELQRQGQDKHCKRCTHNVDASC